MNRRNESFGQERESVTAKQEVKKPGAFSIFLDKFGIGGRWSKEAEFLESTEVNEDKEEEYSVEEMLEGLQTIVLQKVESVTRQNEVDLAIVGKEIQDGVGGDDSLSVELDVLLAENKIISEEVVDGLVGDHLVSSEEEGSGENREIESKKEIVSFRELLKGNDVMASLDFWLENNDKNKENPDWNESSVELRYKVGLYFDNNNFSSYKETVNIFSEILECDLFLEPSDKDRIALSLLRNIMDNNDLIWSVNLFLEKSDYIVDQNTKSLVETVIKNKILESLDTRYSRDSIIFYESLPDSIPGKKEIGLKLFRKIFTGDSEYLSLEEKRDFFRDSVNFLGSELDLSEYSNLANELRDTDIMEKFGIIDEKEKNIEEEKVGVEVRLGKFFGHVDLDIFNQIKKLKEEGATEESIKSRKDLLKRIYLLGVEKEVPLLDEDFLQNFFDIYFLEKDSDSESKNENILLEIEESVKDDPRIIDYVERVGINRDSSSAVERFQDRVYAHKVAEVYKDLFSTGSLDEKGIENYSHMVEVYKKHLENRVATEGKGNINESLEDFQKLFLEEINNGDLKVDIDKVRNKIKSIDFVLTDESSSGRVSAKGVYLSDKERIIVRTMKNDVDFRHTFFHELLHTVSNMGETESKKKMGFSFNSSARKKTSIERTGSVDYNDNGRGNFIWLNEATTEYLALKFSEKKGDDIKEFEGASYTYEVSLLKKIIDAGISEKTIYNSYFEQYQLKQKGEHRQPDLKKLFKEVNEKLGKSFLIDLDDYIVAMGGSKGVVEALITWDKLGDKFPEFLSEWKKGRVEEKRKNKKK